MPQPTKTSTLGLLSKYLPIPGANPPPSQPVRKRGIMGGINAVLNAEPLRNRLLCNVAKNFWTGVSQLSGTALNTPTERKMMDRYFGGGGGAYRLSPAEMQTAIDHYRRFPKFTVGNLTKFPKRNGGYRQNVNFKNGVGEPQLDGLLGTATGDFDRNGNLTGLRDLFDFDDAPRSLGYGTGPVPRGIDAAAGQAVFLTQRDANIFCPGGSNPIRITGGSIR